jgi:hypothetical protein
MAALLALNGNGPGYYQMAGFWRKDARWADMARHMSAREYRAQVNRLNPVQYQKLGGSKIVAKAVLTLLGIPTPRFIGVLDVEYGSCNNARPLRSALDLIECLLIDPADRIAVKLIEGHSGHGFVAAEIVRTATEIRLRPLQCDHEMTAEQFVTRLEIHPQRGRLIEEYLIQHPALAAFNPSSVNTIRPWVLREGARTKTHFAYFRMGRTGSLVDNIWGGGIVAGVDLATGRLTCAHDGETTRNTYAVHPDTGTQIEGAVLPLFHEAIALAEQCVGVFPHIQFAGLDVAITPSGPMVIEMNLTPAREGAGFVGFPTADVFRAR